MLKDAFGNELNAGDLVAIYVEKPIMQGLVREMSGGGIVTGMREGKAEMRPARLVVDVSFTIEAAPGMRIGSVMALRDPAKPQEVSTEKPPETEALN